VKAFEQLGWKDGHNVQITYRFGIGDIGAGPRLRQG